MKTSLDDIFVTALDMLCDIHEHTENDNYTPEEKAILDKAGDACIALLESLDNLLDIEEQKTGGHENA